MIQISFDWSLDTVHSFIHSSIAGNSLELANRTNVFPTHNINTIVISGFERLPTGANPLDAHWLDLQRRYGPPPPGLAVPQGHIPGVYPPSSLASDLLQRERERLERLGEWVHMFCTHIPGFCGDHLMAICEISCEVNVK